MSDFPNMKLKVMVQFPASVYGGTAIRIDKVNQNYTFNLDYAEFLPVIEDLPTTDMAALVWNTVTDTYFLAPLDEFTGGGGGGIEEAPNDGIQYGRQSLAWTPVGATGAIGSIAVVIDGSGVVLTTGMKGYIHIPADITLTSATLLSDQSGSVVVDIFKCTYAQFDAGTTHPVTGDKITASSPPTISSSTKSQDATLTGWTTAIAADSVMGFNVNSVTTIQRVTLSLKYTM